MAKQLRRVHGLVSALRRLKHQDCASVIEHLDDRGIELLSESIHHLIKGHFPIHRRTKHRLRNRIQGQLKEFKVLTRAAEGSRDINKKRRVLKKGGIVGTLLAISSALIPILSRLLGPKK